MGLTHANIPLPETVSPSNIATTMWRSNVLTSAQGGHVIGLLSRTHAVPMQFLENHQHHRIVPSNHLICLQHHWATLLQMSRITYARWQNNFLHNITTYCLAQTSAL